MDRKAVFLLLYAIVASGAVAGDREDYNLRAAQRDAAMFHEFDANHDQKLSRIEVQGLLTMQERFDDIDIDRNDEITWQEMSRYLKQNYAVNIADSAMRPDNENPSPNRPFDE